MVVESTVYPLLRMETMTILLIYFEQLKVDGVTAYGAMRKQTFRHMEVCNLCEVLERTLRLEDFNRSFLT
jgi:hypothetical protein